MRPKRVAIIGLDGMYLDLLKKIIEAGSMPFLDEQLKDGLYGTLKSTVPPYTPPAWTSISTGVTPAKHGIYGFFKKHNFEPKIVSARDVKYPRIWEMLAMNKLNSIVVNLPLLLPFNSMYLGPKDVIIPGWDIPRKTIFPASLAKQKDLLQLLEYPHKWWDARTYNSQEEYISIVLSVLKRKIFTLEKLIRRRQWALLFVVFSETDWIFHKVPQLHTTNKLDEMPNSDKILEVFSIIDTFIATVHDLSDITVICSDHGFGSFDKTLYLNVLLNRLGYLSIRKYHKGPLRRLINSRIFNMVNFTIIRSIIKGNLKARLKRAGLSREPLHFEESIAYSPEEFSIFVRKNEYIPTIKRICLLYTSPSPRDLSTSRMPSSA